MRRFLLVGCGGSGGATLAYMMDQLRSDLAALGIDRMPAGWQFVHVDVPTSADTKLEGVGSVPDQGGRYIATGSATGTYATLDHALSQRLKGAQALSTIATWAPREPEQVRTPPSTGAGQYRAVGRVITLNRVGQLVEGLQRTWEELASVQTLTEMERLGAEHRVLGAFDRRDVPIVLVVGSMAGGAGASMTLDVCRLLTLIPGVSPGLMGVFMASADVFEELPEAARFGTRANALAMLGEIVAAQAGAARQHDVEILRALGYSAGAGVEVPFARVFPVGRYLGDQATVIGDGTKEAVYRALGRGLAALVESDVAHRGFIQFDLGNTGSPAGDRGYLGWGVQWDQLPWGSFGYAALSMGRDRYAEYAAQRIARAAVDRLLDGHLQEGSGPSGNEELQALLDSQWPHVLRSVELPNPKADPGKGGNAVGPWFTQQALPEGEVGRRVAAVLDTEVVPHLASPEGHESRQWVTVLRTQLASRRGAVTAAASTNAYDWAYGWHQALARRTIATVEQAVGLHGLPYAAALVQRLREHVEHLISGLHDLGTHAQPSVRTVPPAFDEITGGLKGVLTNGQAILAKVMDLVRAETRTQVYAQSAELAAQSLASFATDVLQPLGEALQESYRLLGLARESEVRDESVAHLATDYYRAWPAEHDAGVPLRFTRADSEVLLTDPETFPPQFEADVRAAATATAGATSTFVDARRWAASAVISGRWETTAPGGAPGGLLEQSATWRSRVFTADPETGTPIVPARARFDLHARPAELLDRARRLVATPDASFSRYASVSLAEYARGDDVPESGREARNRELVGKFREALGLARPLISVSSDAVGALHIEQKDVSFRFKFSTLPFTDPTLREQLQKVLEAHPALERSTFDGFRTALSGAPEGVTRVDIFGSYMNYSPLAFDSVLRSVARQWAQTPAYQRGEFWKWRRARPLPASLPMGDVERQAMVTGWFLAQVTGDLRIPEEPYGDPVQIWDPETRSWLDFPHPLLTPPESFLQPFDWLPAVLESVLLAYARSSEPPVMSTLRPYQVLRATYDDGESGPREGAMVTLAGQKRLAEWLESGRSRSGGTSRVRGIDTATTPRERAEAAKAFLRKPHEVASVHFMPRGQDGAPGDGQFSAVGDRAQAAVTPIFRDIAPDVRRACERIERLLDGALHRDGLDEVF